MSETIPHAHHWLIESPSGGPTSRGTCRHCGETRDFDNSPDFSLPPMVPAAARHEMRINEMIAKRVVWQGHDKPRAVGF